MLVKLIQAFIIAVLILGLYQAAARLDGWLFPVYSGAWLISATNVINRPNTSLVHMKFAKARDCEYVSGQWYLGIPGASIGVASEWAEPPSIVDTDVIGDSLRYVNMSADSVLRNGFLISTHDCYGGWLWKTNTMTWLSNRDNPNGLESTWNE